jgi:hypothetical protein
MHEKREAERQLRLEMFRKKFRVTELLTEEPKPERKRRKRGLVLKIRTAKGS